MDGRLIYLMGPSGSGKDSLIEAAREPLRRLNCEIIRRVITRSAESVGEDAIGVTPEEFERRQQVGISRYPGTPTGWLTASRQKWTNGYVQGDSCW